MPALPNSPAKDRRRYQRAVGICSWVLAGHQRSSPQVRLCERLWRRDGEKTGVTHREGAAGTGSVGALGCEQIRVSSSAGPEEEINALRSALECGMRAIPHPFLRSRQRARIKAGPLAGLGGILVRRKNRTRLVLSLERIKR